MLVGFQVYDGAPRIVLGGGDGDGGGAVGIFHPSPEVDTWYRVRLVPDWGAHESYHLYLYDEGGNELRQTATTFYNAPAADNGWVQEIGVFKVTDGRAFIDDVVIR